MKDRIWWWIDGTFYTTSNIEFILKVQHERYF